MNQDAAFIAEIVAHPEDTSLRQVYADWLEDQGDPRAEYLRLQSQVEALPETARERKTLLAQLRELRPALDPNWVAALDRTRIELCQVEFEFECPKRWENLTPTEEPTVRFCDVCSQPVYHCDSVKAARDHAAAGHCIAVDSSRTRTAGDLTRRPQRRLGRVRADAFVFRRREFPLGTLVRVTAGDLRGRQGIVEALHGRDRTATLRVRAAGEIQRVTVPVDQLESL